MTKSFSRRQLIKTGFLGAIGSSFIKNAGASSLVDDAEDVTDDTASQNFKVGIASYTFRRLSLDDRI